MPVKLYRDMKRALRHDGTMDSADLLWFTRALRPSPFAMLPRQQQEETFEWIKCPDGDLFDGMVYTDGSLMDNQSECEGRCRALGWSFIVTDADNKVTAAARGCPASWVETIYGAELWATLLAGS
eukprot:1937070-Karenia_brevis.AAC.1